MLPGYFAVAWSSPTHHTSLQKPSQRCKSPPLGKAQFFRPSSTSRIALQGFFQYFFVFHDMLLAHSILYLKIPELSGLIPGATACSDSNIRPGSSSWGLHRAQDCYTAFKPNCWDHQPKLKHSLSSKYHSYQDLLLWFKSHATANWREEQRCTLPSSAERRRLQTGLNLPRRVQNGTKTTAGSCLTSDFQSLDHRTKVQ